MDGYQAYQYYISIKLHFTKDSYDVFQNKGKTTATYESFMKRKDRELFNGLATRFNTIPQYIQFIAANFMYGNPNMIYKDYFESNGYYTEYIKRKQSITRVFEDDLTKIINLNACHDFTNSFANTLLQLYLTKTICLESIVILDSLENIVDNVMNPMVVDDLRLIKKSRGFVKFNTSNVAALYCNFLQEIRCNG